MDKFLSYRSFLLRSIADKKESFYSVKEDKDENKEFETGPMSILMQSVKQNTQVILPSTITASVINFFK